MNFTIINKSNRNIFVCPKRSNKILFKEFMISSEPFTNQNIDDFLSKINRRVDLTINGVDVGGEYTIKSKEEIILDFILSQLPVTKNTFYLVECRFENLLGKRKDIIYISNTTQNSKLVNNRLELTDYLIYLMTKS